MEFASQEINSIKNKTIPHSCGAPFGALSTSANKVLKAHLIVWRANLAYLVFACLLQKQMC